LQNIEVNNANMAVPESFAFLYNLRTMNAMTENKDWIGAWIRKARTHWGRNQEALGEAVSVTKGNISSWENNRHAPGVQQLTMISQVTGYPLPDQILKYMSSNAQQCAIDGSSLSAQAMQVAQAFDRLADPAQKNAMIAMLRTWGVLK
jgi:transcriptional regulator with XRE-family HTH domain